MKKRMLSVLLAVVMTISILCIPANAFYVGMVSQSWHPITGEVTSITLHVKNEDGSEEKLSVFDENGNQLYIQVGPNEWEKLDTPLTPEEVEKMQAEAEAAEEAARVQKKAEMERIYHILISDDYAQTTAKLEELESQIKFIPSALWEKVAAQLSAMGKTLKIEDMRNSFPGGTTYDGYYTDAKVQIDIAPFTPNIVVPHEYGHLIFMTVLPRLYSSSKLQQEWNALTGGEGPAYVSDYAQDTNSYHEDLAETFYSLVTGFVDHYGSVKQMALNYPDCLAIKKINYVRELLCEAFSLEESVFPDHNPSYPSSWAKKEIEQYQTLLGGGAECVIPSQGNAHPTGYQQPATRMQFAYSIYEDLLRSLRATRYFGDMSYAEYESKWKPVPEKVNGVYQIPFTDVDQSEASYTAICAIYSLNLNKIVSGRTSTTFDPNGQITRQEAAAMLYRLCKALGYEFPASSNSYADSDKIAPWAKEAVNAVSAAGIMSGVGNNCFDPTSVYTCEQSALCLVRTYKLLVSTID